MVEDYETVQRVLFTLVDSGLLSSVYEWRCDSLRSSSELRRLADHEQPNCMRDQSNRMRLCET